MQGVERTPDCTPPKRSTIPAPLELVPPDAPLAPDHAANIFTWDVFALCGNPGKPEDQSLYHPDTTENGWFTDPDNIGVDPAGRIWATTDGPPPDGMANAVYAMDTEGPEPRPTAPVLYPADRLGGLLANLHARRYQPLHVGAASGRVAH